MSIKLAVDLLDLSDERDRWLRLALDWARSAYRSGYQHGHRSDTGPATSWPSANGRSPQPG